MGSPRVRPTWGEPRIVCVVWTGLPADTNEATTKELVIIKIDESSDGAIGIGCVRKLSIFRTNKCEKIEFNRHLDKLSRVLNKNCPIPH